MTDVALACRNVWKLYGSNPKSFLAKQGPRPSHADIKDAGYVIAVADATLSVARGEIFVIMGLSGSGKSTLVRCLARLIEPTAGEVMFAGRDLLKATPKQLIELEGANHVFAGEHTSPMVSEVVRWVKAQFKP